MNRFLFAAPLLFLPSAFEKVAEFFAPAEYTTRPAAVRMPAAAKALKGTKTTATVSDVVNAANAFMASLTTAQQATLIQTFNQTNVTKWSNLPVSAGSRLGLQLSTLTAAQQALALAVVQAATGTVAGDGYNEVQQIRAADDNLTANGGGSAYGSGIYLLAFLGTPSLTGTWMLQFGGHHLATNITYTNGAVAGASPKFEATEPLTFTTANANVFPTGTVCAPIANEASAMLAMLNGLTATQKTTARLSQTFNDVVLGPNGNGQFPATKVGLQVSTLTAAQQALVVEAMRPWVQDSDDATAASLMSTYTNELATTYIAYSGTGNLTTSGDYVRIDGRTVWIEFICQGGIVYQSQIHYHTIWRDHARDYGGNFYTTVTGTKSATAAERFSVYPNPISAGQALQVQLANPATAGTYTLRNALGQAVLTDTFRGAGVEVPIANMAAGMYLLSVQADGAAPATQRVTVE
ncbi:DUF3500 domain-containing protein [Hymenobacter rubidus]|uniref:DUF3500 domain-containing protein n=1 Tax=Hymenobacter rubidus TaxID=1441626 RepID=UPI00191FC71B|nr:DUF3500 domain-containing protein [Hymenobacter rubidus]